MKSKIVLIIVAVMILFMAFMSCGNSTGSTISAKIGISVPSNFYGWEGGVSWWAQEKVKELEKTYPGIEFKFWYSPDAGKTADNTGYYSTCSVLPIISSCVSFDSVLKKAL